VLKYVAALRFPTLGNFFTKFVARKATRMRPKQVFSTSNCVAAILTLTLLLVVSQWAYARDRAACLSRQTRNAPRFEPSSGRGG